MISLLLAAALWMPPVPGATNPAVTQENIQETICLQGWTKSVRPPASFTNSLKKNQLKDSRYVDKNPSHYEEDHLISLELGGSPTNPDNLWPQPYGGPCGARVKDILEGELHRRVCREQLPLATAQQLISSNWVLAYQKTVNPLTCGVMK